MPHSVLVERIKFLAKERGIPIKKLQQELGLCSSSIWTWDKYSPSLKSVILIANYFDVSLDYLCGLDVGKHPLPIGNQKLMQIILTKQITDEQAEIIADYIEAVFNFNSECSKMHNSL